LYRCQPRAAGWADCAAGAAAAIPHLTASAGKAVYLSSDAGSFGPPWPGLGAYGVSKAALERLVDAWRAEHPDVGFTCLIVGECADGPGRLPGDQLAVAAMPIGDAAIVRPLQLR